MQFLHKYVSQHMHCSFSKVHDYTLLLVMFPDQIEGSFWSVYLQFQAQIVETCKLFSLFLKWWAIFTNEWHLYIKLLYHITL